MSRKYSKDISIPCVFVAKSVLLVHDFGKVDKMDKYSKKNVLSPTRENTSRAQEKEN